MKHSTQSPSDNRTFPTIDEIEQAESAIQFLATLGIGGFDGVLDILDAETELRRVLLMPLPSGTKEVCIQQVKARCQGVLTDSAFDRLVKAVQREVADVRLKLEIQVYLKETDPFKQIQQKSRICAYYRLSSKNFDQLCQHIRNAERQINNTPKLLSLQELFSKESEALQWLVPGLVPKFTSGLLSALPGEGKSLLAIDLAVAIATGGEFLGERCKQAKVLFISSDQPLNITRTYLGDRGVAPDDPNLTVVGYDKDFAPWTAKHLNILETWVEEFQPDLIIIDSIREAIINPLGLEEKSEQVGHWMREVERITQRCGSLLWIHHDGKNKEHSGVEKASGTTAIPGSVSWHWRLERADRKDPSNPCRILTMPKARGFEPVTLKIRFDADTGTWENQGRLGESEEVAREYQTNQQRLTDLLANHPSGLEGQEIKDLLGGNWNSIKVALGRLTNRGIVSTRRSKTNYKAKIYFLPDCNDFATSNTLLEKTSDTPSPVGNPDCYLRSQNPDTASISSQVTPQVTPQVTQQNSESLLEVLPEMKSRQDNNSRQVTVSGNTLKNFSNKDAVTCEETLTNEPDGEDITTQIKVGDLVDWLTCPGNLEQFNPFEVIEIKGDTSRLDCVAVDVPIKDLKLKANN